MRQPLSCETKATVQQVAQSVRDDAASDVSSQYSLDEMSLQTSIKTGPSVPRRLNPPNYDAAVISCSDRGRVCIITAYTTPRNVNSMQCIPGTDWTIQRRKQIRNPTDFVYMRAQINHFNK